MRFVVVVVNVLCSPFYEWTKHVVDSTDEHIYLRHNNRSVKDEEDWDFCVGAAADDVSGNPEVVLTDTDDSPGGEMRMAINLRLLFSWGGETRE